jgi:2-methylisocitrate lyase-like PEP mutase family enzyme
MSTAATARERLLALHRPGEPLLLPNPWDPGTARVLAAAGFSALATTSSGFAATLGRPDGTVKRDEALGHAAAIVAAVDVPVSADLEDGYGPDPKAVAATVEAAAGTGLAGCSIEDWSGGTILPVEVAAERIVAASEAAAGRLVLTGRAENLIHDRPDLADTITRLQAYQEAGADVLYAPGLVEPADIRAVVGAVDRPVNVLLRPSGPTIDELAALGVSRISLGGTLAFVALGALARAAAGLLRGESDGLWDLAGVGRAAADAFVEPR